MWKACDFMRKKTEMMHSLQSPQNNTLAIWCKPICSRHATTSQSRQFHCCGHTYSTPEQTHKSFLPLQDYRYIFLKASNWKSRTADLQAEQPSLARWSPLCSDQEVKHPRTRFTVSNTLKGSGRGRASPSANFWKRLQNLAYLQNHLPAS